MIQMFKVLKKTGSLADATMAAGLGVLLQTLTDSVPFIRDAGPCLEVSLGQAVDLGRLPYERLLADPGYLYVKKAKTTGGAPLTGAVIDYEDEKSKAEAEREARKAKKVKAQVGTETEGGAADFDVRPDWRLYQQLNVLQAYGSYNGLHQAVREADPSRLALSVQAKLEAMAEGRDPATVETVFSYPASPVQGFNPLVGKGVNSPKADGARVRSLDENYTDWFDEWLRYAGTAAVATAAPIGKDIKMMAIAPAAITLKALRQEIREELLAAAGSAWTSSQIDITCALKVARRLVEGSGLLERPEEWTLKEFTPRDLIAGIHSAYFKSLGTGKAVSNLSFIALPGWFPVRDAQTAQDWLDIISEHLGAVSFLREDRSEEYALLRDYRDFLSGHSVRAFLDFASAYGIYVIRAREHRRRARQLTTVNMGKVVQEMEGSFSFVLASEGFQNVARAMRRATVGEQFHKAQGRQQYDIHYGLFHELRRSSGSKDRLMKAVAGFVCVFNAENAKMSERAAPGGRGGIRRRAQVTTKDLEEFAAIVDSHGPETIALLLAAYASAREPREEEPEAAGAVAPIVPTETPAS
jgi:hypothetical protein